MDDGDYLLGTGDDEIERLGLQHSVWRPHAARTWNTSGFRQGQTIIDVGCGPGFASLDLADVVGRSGRIVAIDRSTRFTTHLQNQRDKRDMTQIDVIQGDLHDPIPVQQADGAWCRWTAAFVRDPSALVAGIRAALRTGGTAAFHEYGEYRTWRLNPDCPLFDRFVDQVIHSWRQEGGEPDVGRWIPGWLESSGFEVLSVRAIVEVVTPRDYMWQWPREFVRVGSERLRRIGAIDAREAEETWLAFARAEALPGARMITPSVLEIIARAV